VFALSDLKEMEDVDDTIVPSEKVFLLRRLSNTGIHRPVDVVEKYRLKEVQARTEPAVTTTASSMGKQFHSVAQEHYGKRQWKTRPLVEAELQSGQSELRIRDLSSTALVSMLAISSSITFHFFHDVPFRKNSQICELMRFFLFHFVDAFSLTNAPIVWRKPKKDRGRQQQKKDQRGNGSTNSSSLIIKMPLPSGQKRKLPEAGRGDHQSVSKKKKK
tara:strand:- start:387 stop:1037 length:651 start_codon:yes stop_codon:yes gene_type:complete